MSPTVKAAERLGVRVDRRVQKVSLLMQAELHRSMPLHQFAESVNLSDSRLRHLFTSRTGRSPSQFLKSLRMQRAKELTETTFLSIKEIMNSVGISDPSHFVRDFEKRFGLSPARFRAIHGARQAVAPANGGRIRQ